MKFYCPRKDICKSGQSCVRVQNDSEGELAIYHCIHLKLIETTSEDWKNE